MLLANCIQFDINQLENGSRMMPSVINAGSFLSSIIDIRGFWPSTVTIQGCLLCFNRTLKIRKLVSKAGKVKNKVKLLWEKINIIINTHLSDLYRFLSAAWEEEIADRNWLSGSHISEVSCCALDETNLKLIETSLLLASPSSDPTDITFYVFLKRTFIFLILFLSLGKMVGLYQQMFV